jgi:DMSO/TMAO reductase YedYZ molybdopterin-dependent catalytic subunit
MIDEHPRSPIDTATPPPSKGRLIAGVVAVAAALGAQELAAGLARPLPSLMEGMASWVIDVAPAALVDWAIHTLGSGTKPTLIACIALVALIIGAAVARTPFRVRIVTYSVFGLWASLITARADAVMPAGALASGLFAAGVAVAVDRLLTRESRPAHSASRRAFLTQAIGLAGLAVVAAGTGRYLLDRTRMLVSRREDVVLPQPLRLVAAPTPAHDFDIEGLAEIVTPNERFFRVDISPLSPPEIDLATWKLTIGGRVGGAPLTLDYADLMSMDMVEKYITIACVSNEVGGRLVGTAAWRGVPLREVLDLVGVDPTAEQVVAKGADGFSSGIPIEAVYDRDTLLAVGMNGEPLPTEHGFPARLVVPGLYGFVSAAKWIHTIELTGWEEYDCYWVPMGWAKDAPIHTQSRIDAPRDGMTIEAGARKIGGVAWAPTRGISRVEVSIDGGPWVDTELSVPLSKDTWVQWQIPWTAEPGEHTIDVRATDGDGVTQTTEVAHPVPSGATGQHRVVVTVA